LSNALAQKTRPEWMDDTNRPTKPILGHALERPANRALRPQTPHRYGETHRLEPSRSGRTARHRRERRGRPSAKWHLGERPAGLRPGSLVQSANGHQLGRPDVWTSNARLGSVALLVLGLGGKGEPFYSQIEVPIFCMIMEAFCTLKTFGRLGPIRFAYRVETPRNQGVEAHDPGHSTQCG